MKAQPILAGLACLALSLSAAVVYVHQRPELPVQPIVPASAADTCGDGPASSELSPSTTNTVSPLAFSWRQVESEDYHQYIANLRLIGCPEQTIRDIIVADVNKLYAEREKPLKIKPQTTPGSPAAETPQQELERLRQLRTVQQEKRWVVKELLGIDLPLDLLPSSGSRDYHAFEVALRSIPAEKREAVQSLQETYWQQSDSLKTKYGPKKTAEFQAEARQLNDNLRQDLAKVLTPQELEDYDLRTSPAAKQLSDKLATYFRPTESEFRQIYRATREYNDALEQWSIRAAQQATQPPTAADPAALAQQRAAERQAMADARSSALNQMNEQLKTALGQDRYTEYERSQDRNYDLLARLGVRYELPQETVLQAYEVQKSFSAPPAGAAQPGTPQPDRAELQKQLNDKLTSILGERAARGYRRVNGGSIPLANP